MVFSLKFLFPNSNVYTNRDACAPWWSQSVNQTWPAYVRLLLYCSVNLESQKQVPLFVRTHPKRHLNIAQEPKLRSFGGERGRGKKKIRNCKVKSNLKKSTLFNPLLLTIWNNIYGCFFLTLDDGINEQQLFSARGSNFCSVWAQSIGRKLAITHTNPVHFPPSTMMRVQRGVSIGSWVKQTSGIECQCSVNYDWIVLTIDVIDLHMSQIALGANDRWWSCGLRVCHRDGQEVRIPDPRWSRTIRFHLARYRTWPVETLLGSTTRRVSGTRLPVSSISSNPSSGPWRLWDLSLSLSTCY